MLPLCRYEFFAPIWRIMRDDNMAVSEVARQVEGVALAVKQGSSVSDLRHHVFTGKLKGAQVRLRQMLLCNFLVLCNILNCYLTCL